MNRRKFLKSLTVGLAALTAARATSFLWRDQLKKGDIFTIEGVNDLDGNLVQWKTMGELVSDGSIRTDRIGRLDQIKLYT